MPSYARAPLLCTDLAIIYACAEYESDYEFEEDDTRPLVNEAGWRVDRPGVDPTPVPDEAVSASKLALLGYSAPPVPGGALKLSRATQYNTEPERNSDIDVSK